MGKLSDEEVEAIISCAEIDAFYEGYEEGRKYAEQLYNQ